MSLYDELNVRFDADARRELEPEPELEIFAYAMPRGTPHGGAAVHLALRAPGMVMNYNMPLEPARKAHARLGEALRTFELAREMAGHDAVAAVYPERPVLSGDHASREQERLYRAKLSIRLGLTDDDIRTVFDLSAAELAALRVEVAGA